MIVAIARVFLEFFVFSSPWPPLSFKFKYIVLKSKIKNKIENANETKIPEICCATPLVSVNN